MNDEMSAKPCEIQENKGRSEFILLFICIQ